MSELKSLSEIRLEIDLIMVDIEVLGQSDKDEAVKYLENSLEELKIVSNWELQNTVDHYEHRNEDIDAANVERSVANKRIKLESPQINEAENTDDLNHLMSPQLEMAAKVDAVVKPEESPNSVNNSQMVNHVKSGEHTGQHGLPNFYAEVGEAEEGNAYSSSEENTDAQEPDQHEASNNERDHTENKSEKLLEESAMDNQLEETYYPSNTFGNATRLDPSEYYESLSKEQAKICTNNVEPSVTLKPIVQPVLYNGKVPTCAECNATFPSLGVLDTHLKNGHKEKVANRQTTRRTPVVRNPVYVQNNGEEESPEIRENMDGTFQCPFCVYKSTAKYNIKVHMNRHNGKFRCDVCDVNLSRQQSFDNHLRTVEHLKKIGRSHASPGSPMDHQATEFNTYSQGSPAMDPARSGQDGVLEQLFSENVSVDGQNFSMDFLLDSSPQKSEEYVPNLQLDPEPVPVSQSSLNDYMNQQLLKNKSVSRTSSANPQSFDCEQCGNSYNKYDSLKRHMISHSDRFKCATCGYGFTEQGRLNSHLRNKENCIKLLKARGQGQDTRIQPTWQLPESYPSTPVYPTNPEWAGNSFESGRSPADLLPGVQITRKPQASPRGNFPNGFGLNSSLAEKFFSNPNLSVQVKKEPRNY